jgi:hypothetical protein
MQILVQSYQSKSQMLRGQEHRLQEKDYWNEIYRSKRYIRNIKSVSKFSIIFLI